MGIYSVPVWRVVKVAITGYHASMRSVGIKILKDKLSEYIRLVASGETIFVTDRDRIVAELTAPRKFRSPRLADATLAELVRTGLLRPPTLPPGAPFPEIKGVMKLDDVLSDLDDARADR